MALCILLSSKTLSLKYYHPAPKGRSKINGSEVYLISLILINCFIFYVLPFISLHFPPPLLMSLKPLYKYTTRNNKNKLYLVSKFSCYAISL